MKHYIIASLTAVAMLTSCSETDIEIFDSPLSENGQGTLSNNASTVRTLDFSWTPLDGVHQYGYRLLDFRNNPLRQGITKVTELHFENLEPDTEYTLEIEAYGANGEPTTRFSLSASTAAIRRLATPDTDHASISIDNGRATITWPAVEGAEWYEYQLLSSTGDELVDGTVTTPSVVFNTLPVGDYSLLITADSEYEGYTRSETATYNFTRQRQVVETYTGTYVSEYLGTSETRTLNIYDDGSYQIVSFYGNDGYDLEFSISGTRVISILNAYYEEGKYKYVAFGPKDDDYVIVFEDTSYCTYSVLPSGKRIKIYVYYSDSQTGSYDTFTWK